MHYTLGLPSLKEIHATKRQRLSLAKAKTTSYVCNYNQEEKQGAIEMRVVGEARFDPKSLADVSRDKPEEMMRKSAKVVQLEAPILPPPLISMEDSHKEPKEKRVSLTESKLMEHLLELFRQREAWKVEEMVE